MNDVMYSSKSDLWETPKWLFDNLNDFFGFDIDVCALPENAKCKSYYTPEQDGLTQPWEGVVWCNPPYGRDIWKWVKKAYDENQKNNNYIMMLLPARTDTKWFHDYIYGNGFVDVRFIRGRLKFSNAKNAAPFPSMVVIFNPRIGRYRK